MSVVQDAVQAVMKKAIALAPDGWVPGGHPDPLMHHKHGLIGASISRIDGPLKVSGKAQFCAEFPMERLTYAALEYSTIARGRITVIDTGAAEAASGVVLVMTPSQRPEAQSRPAVHEQAQGRRSRRPFDHAG
jgi:xanthine dehydrogenase YagR molybdenum-binding subunit